ncbi:V-type proton ATPase subunit E [Paramuricea clavata]|uniref:V-type proton ATPase subunit E n=1 Tax=Paramuricea clavata TaxID=317549 RepID=A0A6S7G1V7_PARCT|nr:V-type proton ATPase subunit E [Paramuricea clavata]
MAAYDNEVQKQIKHMMAFIEQEAKEKAEEIDAKAEEEFNIEKGRLVQQERLKIKTYYEKKEKQVALQKKIQRSNQLNQSRLKILKAKDDHIKQILEEACEKLADVTKDSEKYSSVLLGLITQGLFQLLESEVTIRCRKEDLDLIKKIRDEACSKFKEAAKKDVKINIDENKFLSSNSSGGVDLICRRSTIHVQNTLESRLSLLSGQMLPEIRERLFGKNPSRKFLD